MSFPYQIKSFEDYLEQYKISIEQPEKFWAGVAENFTWIKKWDKVLEWNFKEPRVRWFEGAKLNITENCLDRHLADKAGQPAIIWEPNDPAQKNRILSYRELYISVCRFVQVLKNNGVRKGDRVCIYMPMIPELAIAVLACARMGAIHSVVFGGFSAQSIADRIEDAKCKVVITADGGNRGPKEILLKATIDEALQKTSHIQKVIVYKHLGNDTNMVKVRDVWWQEELKKVTQDETPAESMDTEDMLFILYTSGSTGKPKGVVHSCAGYMIYTTYSFVNVFQYKPGDIYFCTADVGWITGHSYTVYGPLCAGATTIMFEGIPSYPDAGRFWDIIDKYKVNIFYTAPTAIRSLMGFGTEPLKNKSLGSLRVLGTVGEPINEEAWHWYDENIGRHRCPIVDTWWQTETGGIMISNLAGISEGKPSYATLPLPGIIPVLVDEKGQPVPGSDAGKDGVFRRDAKGDTVSGNLCIRFPWPSIIRTTYGDHERCRLNYFATYPDLYFTGDGALRDAAGNYRITGRVDDVLNVSGHRIGTAEVENAINMYPDVVESAVVGYPHDIKGQGIYAFVTLNRKHHVSGEDKAGVSKMVNQIIGAIAKPDKIQFVSGLPKTRSGKIMRRILRKIAEGEMENLGDISTLVDPAVVEEIKSGRL
ncbi:MAG TPA: acetate--CoA ligase [Puia sp.]|jgi:acetyl-CoA synthetase|nr:acetate--CoA ligase [Puia sp.]